MATIPQDTHTKGSLTRDRLRVVVADDGKNAADIIAMFFEMEGHDVRVAYDGAAAVEISASFRPHLVVMDIGMPGMDGFEASRRIRDLPEGHEIVIIALSGHDREEDKARCGEAGFNRHLSKPVHPEDLRNLIQSYQLA